MAGAPRTLCILPRNWWYGCERIAQAWQRWRSPQILQYLLRREMTTDSSESFHGRLNRSSPETTFLWRLRRAAIAPTLFAEWKPGALAGLISWRFPEKQPDRPPAQLGSSGMFL